MIDLLVKRGEMAQRRVVPPFLEVTPWELFHLSLETLSPVVPVEVEGVWHVELTPKGPGPTFLARLTEVSYWGRVCWEAADLTQIQHGKKEVPCEDGDN